MTEKLRIIDETAELIVSKIAELPKGTEFFMWNYFSPYKFETYEYFQLLESVLDMCKSKGIELINMQEGMFTGLPFNSNYKKNN